MIKKRTEPLHWVRLDNAAKIYPAARRRNWSNVFRQSMTLSEDIDIPVLKSALDITVIRFPSIAARLRRGVFWYYLQQMDRAPEIRSEKSCPLVFMNRNETRSCAFRVIAYRNRIAVEFFHALTDGSGALIFLKSLVAEYIEQKYGVLIPAEHGVLDRRQAPRPAELEDSFPKYAGRVCAGRGGSNAWRMRGEPQPGGFLNLTCFHLPVQETLRLAHGFNATVTVFLAAAMLQALIRLQAETISNPRRRKGIKLLIPVNLRKIFPSETLRNFSMYTIPELDPRLGTYSFGEICDIVRHRMGLDINAKYMGSMIATNVHDEQNLLLRLVPLPIKNIVMKAVFDSVGERKACLTLSNLGTVQLPEAMKPYVRRMDFILGVQAAAPYNCGVISWGDTIYVNFIRNIREPGLERHFFAVLHEMGLHVRVESNLN